MPKSFPKELLGTSISLEHLGLIDVAWNWEDAIKAIVFLNNNNYVILGGDVFVMADETLNTTYDSWYCNRNESKTNRDFMNDSMHKAIKYINQYHERNGDLFYYSFVPVLILN